MYTTGPTLRTYCKRLDSICSCTCILSIHYVNMHKKYSTKNIQYTLAGAQLLYLCQLKILRDLRKKGKMSSLWDVTKQPLSGKIQPRAKNIMSSLSSDMDNFNNTHLNNSMKTTFCLFLFYCF